VDKYLADVHKLPQMRKSGLAGCRIFIMPLLKKIRSFQL
jgi:hypothetical protein